MKKQKLLYLILIIQLLLIPNILSANENPLIYSDVDQYEDNHYKIKVLMNAAAPPAAIISELQKFSQIKDLHEDILSSKLLSSKNKIHQVEITTNRCLLFICFPTKQTLNFSQTDARTLVASIVPEKSDFKSGRMRWFVSKKGNGSLLEYTGEFEPDFWVPPVIGTWIVEMDLSSVSVEVLSTLVEKITGVPQKKSSVWDGEGESTW